METYDLAQLKEDVLLETEFTTKRVKREGAKLLGPVVSTMAKQESLDAHRLAMELRYKD